MLLKIFLCIQLIIALKATCETNEYDDGNGNCLPCDSSCSSCTGGSDTQCTLCTNPTNYVLDEDTNSCIADTYCVGYIWVDGADPNNRICKNCDVSCATCSGGGSDNCITCANTDLYVVDEVTSVCIAKNQCTGWIDEGANKCKVCEATCATCDGGTLYNCLTCVDPDNNCYEESAKKCRAITSLAANEWVQATDSTCQLCHSDCATCSGGNAGNCLTCSNPVTKVFDEETSTCIDEADCEGQKWRDEIENVCKPCDSSCFACGHGSATYCTDCLPTQFMTSDNQCQEKVDCGGFVWNSIDNTCGEACSSNCFTCEDVKTQCSSCGEDEWLDEADYRCYAKAECPGQLWYSHLNTCGAECEGGCLNCQDELTKCISCPEHLEFDEINNLCKQPASDFREKCVEPNQHYNERTKTCVDWQIICLDDSNYYDYSAQKCASCSANIDNCQKCSDIQTCLKCQDGWFVNEENKCFACGETCVTCTEQSTCTSCINTKWFNENTQLCNTDKRLCTKADVFYKKEDNTCQPCHYIQNCKECSNRFECDVCQDGWYLNGIECATCQPECETCSDAFSCDKKAANNILKSIGNNIGSAVIVVFVGLVSGVMFYLKYNLHLIAKKYLINSTTTKRLKKKKNKTIDQDKIDTERQFIDNQYESSATQLDTQMNNKSTIALKAGMIGGSSNKILPLVEQKKDKMQNAGLIIQAKVQKLPTFQNFLIIVQQLNIKNVQKMIIPSNLDQFFFVLLSRKINPCVKILLCFLMHLIILSSIFSLCSPYIIVIPFMHASYLEFFFPLPSASQYFAPSTNIQHFHL